MCLARSLLYFGAVAEMRSTSSSLARRSGRGKANEVAIARGPHARDAVAALPLSRRKEPAWRKQPGVAPAGRAKNGVELVQDLFVRSPDQGLRCTKFLKTAELKPTCSDFFATGRTNRSVDAASSSSVFRSRSGRSFPSLKSRALPSGPSSALEGGPVGRRCPQPDSSPHSTPSGASARYRREQFIHARRATQP